MLGVVFLAALDLTVVAPILPTVISDLNINTVDADRYAWIVLAYLVAYTATVPLTGRLSDYLGRLPVFAGAMLLFMAGSLVAAQAEGLGTMIVGRTLQGLGGGAMLPVSMALVADIVPPQRRAAALGLVAAVDTFGWVLGPVWGAAVHAAFDSWRAIFWLNLPLGALAALALLWARPHLGRPAERDAPNLLSAVLGVTGLVAATVALSSGGEAGLSAEQGAAALGGSVNPVSAYRWPLLGFAALALIGFVISEWKARSPLLPRALIRSRLFQLAGGANLLVGAALIVAMVNAPLTIALLADEDQHAGYTALILGAFTLLMTAGAIIGGRVANRVDGRWPALAGLAIGAAGFALMSAWTDELNLSWMSVTVGIAGLGLGIVIAPIAEAAIRAAGTASYGAASGLVLLARLIGMTVGLAGVTSFALARLDVRVSELPAIPPNPGESTADYFNRQQTYLEEQLIPLTLDVVHETFLVAAALCLLTIPLVLLMRQRRGSAATAAADD